MIEEGEVKMKGEEDEKKGYKKISPKKTCPPQRVQGININREECRF